MTTNEFKGLLIMATTEISTATIENDTPALLDSLDSFNVSIRQ